MKCNEPKRVYTYNAGKENKSGWKRNKLRSRKFWHIVFSTQENSTLITFHLIKYKEMYYTISKKNLPFFSVSVGQNKEGESKSQISIFYVTSVSPNIYVLTTVIPPILAVLKLHKIQGSGYSSISQLNNAFLCVSV
jgi:hypothetical protein